MLKERRNQVLIGLAVVQVVLVVLVFWPRPVGGRGAPLLPDFQSSDIVAFTVTDPGDKRLTLRNLDGAWVLPDFDDYPAQGSKVVLLLEQIAGLTTDDLVAQTAAGQKQLKVAADDFAHRLDLQKADGTAIRLYLGTSPRLNTVHVRLEGQTQTYLGVGLSTSTVDSRPISWVEPLYLSVVADEVTALQVQNPNGLFSFGRGEDGNWTMAGLQVGETLDQTAVRATLQQAASVRMLGPLGRDEKPEYGLAEPSAVVTLTMAEREIVLRVGALNEEDASFVVKSSESPYYVRVSTAGLRRLVETARSGFLVPPPTATPTPEVTATPTISPTTGLVSGIGITATAVITGTPGTRP